MDDRRRARYRHSDPPADALSPSVLGAIVALLEPRHEVIEARVSQVTKTFDGVEVARHLSLALWLSEPPEQAGDARVQALTMDLFQTLDDQTGISGISVPTAIARRPFENQGVLVFARE